MFPMGGERRKIRHKKKNVDYRTLKKKKKTYISNIQVKNSDCMRDGSGKLTPLDKTL